MMLSSSYFKQIETKNRVHFTGSMSHHCLTESKHNEQYIGDGLVVIICTVSKGKLTIS